MGQGQFVCKLLGWDGKRQLTLYGRWIHMKKHVYIGAVEGISFKV